MLTPRVTSFTTSRLEVVKASSDMVGELTFLRKIPSILSVDVVNNLPDYFHDISNTADAEKWLARMLVESQLFVVMSLHKHDVLGFVFIFTDNDVDVHIGYLLKRSTWGRGIATELLTAFIEYAKNNHRWQQLIAGVELDNSASIKLLEKVGFVQQNTLKDKVIFYHYPLA